MTNATNTAAATVATTPAEKPVVVAAPKAPSKKSLSTAIFQKALKDRAEGKFKTNREFRAAVLVAMEKELGVTRPSAATMYNAAKTEAEAAEANLGLGRDPKKEKAVSTGKRGRPAGSKNRAKDEATPAAEVKTEAVTDAKTVAVDTTPETVEAATETQETATA